jgi:hypothetical protein
MHVLSNQLLLHFAATFMVDDFWIFVMLLEKESESTRAQLQLLIGFRLSRKIDYGINKRQKQL